MVIVVLHVLSYFKNLLILIIADYENLQSINYST